MALRAAPPPPPPPPPEGPLTVSFAGESAQAVALSCSSGANLRASFVGGVAAFDAIPTDDACTLSFRGGAPGSYGPVHGNMSINCAFDEAGGTYSCR